MCFIWEITEEKILDMARKYQTIISSSMVSESLNMTVRRLTKHTTLASASSVLLRQKILKKCRDDIYHFLNHENGQVAIYDAVNPLAAGRRSLAREFAKHDVQVNILIFLS